MKRSCPSRGLTVDFLTQIAPKFFPTSQCHSGIRVRFGVLFESQIVELQSGSLEVYKAVTATNPMPGEPPRDLMILLHGFPETPLIWSKYISVMREKTSSIFNQKFEYWSVALPGWGQGSKLTHCRMRDAADLIADLVREESSRFLFMRCS